MRNRILSALYSLAGLAVISLAFFFLLQLGGPTAKSSLGSEASKLEQPTIPAPQNLKCISDTEDRIVSGDSLSGLIESGQTVRVLMGFYDCNEPGRGDVIIYNYAGDKNPLIKVIKGISGDKFQLKKSGDGSTSSPQGGWNILINGIILKTSSHLAVGPPSESDKPYVFSDAAYKMLSLYEKDYKGVIPPNTYLILGNQAGGSLDSSHFGLVDKKDISGKVSPP